MAWVDPRTWAADEIVTAAKMNEIRDSLKAVGDEWLNYTPTWTAATTAPAIGNGAIYGKYMQAGKWINFKCIMFSGTGTTQGTGVQSLTVPVAATSVGGAHIAPLRIYTGTNVFAGTAIITGGTTTMQPWVPTSTGNCALVQMAATTPNIGNAGTGYLVIEGTYEAA